MIQGGDPKKNGSGEPGYVIPDEVWEGAKHDRAGLLCMANRGKNTNGAQFFITDAAAAHLDSGYTIFGECGPVDVIHKIAEVPVVRDQPQTPPDIRRSPSPASEGRAGPDGGRATAGKSAILGAMRQHLFLLLLVVAPASVAAASAALPGCGTVVVAAQTEGTGGRAAASSSTTGFGGVGGSGGSVASSSTGYVDPGCPDAGPPGMMFSCDPFGQDCPSRGGLLHLHAEPVGAVRAGGVRSRLRVRGQRHPGHLVRQRGVRPPASRAWCREPATSAWSSAELQGAMGCPDGLVCQPIDVEGFGGCL